MQDHDRGDSMDRATLILATLLSRVPAIRVRATMVHSSSGVPGAGIPHSDRYGITYDRDPVNAGDADQLFPL